MNGVIGDVLAPGLVGRPAEMSDAEAIFGVIAAYNTAIVGFPDFTLADVRDELAEPGFDRATDSWLVFDQDERLVGFGWAYANGDSGEVFVDAMSADGDVTEWLFDRVCERALEMARARGKASVKIHKGMYRDDHDMKARLEARRFSRVTTFQRMRIDHVEPVPMPEPPPGITIREATDDDTRRAAYDVDEEAFADHFGFAHRPHEEWIQRHETQSTFDWPQLCVAYLDGRPVAFCGCTDQFVQDEDCGYVATLGVVPDARGRGIASYLLRRAFAIDAAAGRVGTLLHVDSNNTTPALGLYESVGMRSVLVVDVWERVLPVGDG
jgi:ribosomal protein S18 acetylase RimI-like enzyme